MHSELASPCQLRPYAMQAYRMHVFPNISSQPQGDPSLPFNISGAEVVLPATWPASFSLPSYLWGDDIIHQLRDAVIVTIGDSLDRQLAEAFCAQAGLYNDFLEPSNRSENYKIYHPHYCHAPERNLTWLHVHHYGVMSGWWPTQDYNTMPYSTRHVLETHLPDALRLRNLTMRHVSLIQLNSGLWDLHAKNSSYSFTPRLMQERWMPLMREQLMEPLLKLIHAPVDGVANTNTPLLVVKTCPPNKWGEERQLDVAIVNDGLRAIAHEYAARTAVQLLDLAVVLAERQAWCMDGHHYAADVELQHANLLLNIWAERYVHGRQCAL